MDLSRSMRKSARSLETTSYFRRSCGAGTWMGRSDPRVEGCGVRPADGCSPQDRGFLLDYFELLWSKMLLSGVGLSSTVSPTFAPVLSRKADLPDGDVVLGALRLKPLEILHELRCKTRHGNFLPLMPLGLNAW